MPIQLINEAFEIEAKQWKLVWDLSSTYLNKYRFLRHCKVVVVSDVAS